jgi:hypothetical protein
MYVPRVPLGNLIQTDFSSVKRERRVKLGARYVNHIVPSSKFGNYDIASTNLTRLSHFTVAP